jgi:hypothetical protein
MYVFDILCMIHVCPNYYFHFPTPITTSCHHVWHSQCCGNSVNVVTVMRLDCVQFVSRSKGFTFYRERKSNPGTHLASYTVLLCFLCVVSWCTWGQH